MKATTTIINETYKQMKARHEKEYNARFDELKPLVFYAFGRDQQNAAIAAYKDADGKLDELASAGAGLMGDYTALKQLINLLDRHADELTEALQNREFSKGAFKYEMANHEYSYTYDDEEVLNALGLEGLTDDLRECYEEARREYLEVYSW